MPFVAQRRHRGNSYAIFSKHCFVEVHARVTEYGEVIKNYKKNPDNPLNSRHATI